MPASAGGSGRAHGFLGLERQTVVMVWENDQIALAKLERVLGENG
jgi:hypothetical protein